MSEENNNNWSEREIGALWKQQSGKGTKYLSGHVKGSESSDQQRVVVFANKDKKNSKAPDFRMYLSQPNESSASGASSTSETDVEDVLD
tara:strand:- start:9473 stop:9739 length:267 start_codon:yes stop_codon:yes gene_type:complete